MHLKFSATRMLQLIGLFTLVNAGGGSNLGQPRRHLPESFVLSVQDYKVTAPNGAPSAHTILL